MRQGSRNDLLIAAAFCGALGLYDLLYVTFLLSGGPVIGPALSVLFPDFLVFWAAAHAWVEGKLALVYSIDAFTDYQNVLFADRFPNVVHFRPFFYPPIWLLMLLPLGAIAVGKAYALFMTGTMALATALEGRRDIWGWLAIVTSPAAVWTVLAGQNTFLSVALFYGGFALLERAPVAAGILLGLLAYKPQIWALVPLALLAARQWRALAWMAGTVLVVALASLAVFGPAFWLAFLDAAREAGSARVVNEMFERIYMHMTTLLAAARILGLPPALSGAVQVAGSLLAVGAVVFAFGRKGQSDARLAVLATATFLVSPYTLNYDLLLLMPAVVAMFRRAVLQGFFPAERVVMLLLWLSRPSA
jgi:alpha-1,2-mannosyltransferase